MYYQDCYSLLPSFIIEGYGEFQLEINENIYIILSSKFMDPENSWTPWKSTDPSLKTPVYYLREFWGCFFFSLSILHIPYYLQENFF